MFGGDVFYEVPTTHGSHPLQVLGDFLKLPKSMAAASRNAASSSSISLEHSRHVTLHPAMHARSDQQHEHGKHNI